MVKNFLGIEMEKLSAYPVALLKWKLVIAICVNRVTGVKDLEWLGELGNSHSVYVTLASD